LEVHRDALVVGLNCFSWILVSLGGNLDQSRRFPLVVFMFES